MGNNLRSSLRVPAPGCLCYVLQDSRAVRNSHCHGDFVGRVGRSHKKCLRTTITQVSCWQYFSKALRNGERPNTVYE